MTRESLTFLSNLLTTVTFFKEFLTVSTIFCYPFMISFACRFIHPHIFGVNI